MPRTNGKFFAEPVASLSLWRICHSFRQSILARRLIWRSMLTDWNCGRYRLASDFFLCRSVLSTARFLGDVKIIA
jgi:hypothetical protein